jgi:UDP-GlcNAc:undecaprenyl-phosphate GlcNAc-1-phosphate transferase
MVIYLVQAALFVLAYLLRYESDLLILGVFTAFFATTIMALQIATRTGWRLRSNGQRFSGGSVTRLIHSIRHAALLHRLSYAAIALSLGTYAVLIVVDAAHLNWDLHVLVIALLAAVVVVLAIMRVAPLNIVEKGLLYVTATVLVYLDALVLPSSPLICVLSWVAVSVAAVATALRLRLLNDRRFELTTLDILVVFVTLVVPNLPGNLGLPHGGALAIAKLVVIVYATEMLICRAEKRAVWMRIAAASVLAGLTIRSFLTL